MTCFVVGFIGCSDTPTDGEETSRYQDPEKKEPKDQYIEGLDDDSTTEELIDEVVELLTGSYLDAQDAQDYATEILSYPQILSKLKELLGDDNRARYEFIYIAGLSGLLEFSDVLFDIASISSLDPESVSEWDYERRENERLAALTALGRLGDVDSLEALLDVVPDQTQISVWIELYRLDSEKWPMREVSAGPEEDLLADPDYRELYDKLTEELEMDDVVVLDDGDDECDELHEMPDDELGLALTECEDEACDALWTLAEKCDEGCPLGCNRAYDSTNEINEESTHAESSRWSATTPRDSVALTKRSCPDTLLAEEKKNDLTSTNDELGWRHPEEQAKEVFVQLSEFLPDLLAGIIAVIVLEAEHVHEWCKASLINRYKNDYSFNGSWNKGMGANTPCNLSTGIGRTLNAIHLLHTASPREPVPWYNTYDDLLAEGGTYTQSKIPKLAAKCSNKSAYMSTKARLIKKKRKVTVYPGGFYSLSTAERAATLVHEARHTQRCRHNGNDGKNKCPSRSSSCDESIFDGCKKRVLGPPKGSPGAVAYGVKWATLYLQNAAGDKIDDYQRDKVRSYINFRLNERFDVDPGYNVTKYGQPFECRWPAVINGVVMCECRREGDCK